MRFALLGGDEDTRVLERLIGASNDHEIFSVPSSEWESLLARSDFDVVLIARGPDELLRIEQFRKLVGAGVPVAATHPAADVLTAYEIEMIRRESRGVLIPLALDWSHPAWEFIVTTLLHGQNSPVGRIEQITFERIQSDRSRDSVLTQLAQDIGIIRPLLGTVSSVNAVGTSRDDDSFAALTVHFSNEASCTVNWSIASPAVGKATSVQLAGDRGTAVLNIPQSRMAAWELSFGDDRRETFADSNPVTELAERIRLAIAGSEPNPSWADACLDLEIADTAEKSLRKKRTIDLYTSERSEAKTFKGFMAAAGCLILMVILLAFFGLAVWDGLRAPFRDDVVATQNNTGGTAGAAAVDRPGWPLWIRMWPVYPLLAFLLLQLLLFITRSPHRDSTANAGSQTS